MIYSFVSVTQGYTDCLLYPCKVEEHIRNKHSIFSGKDWSAMWDTGATASVISPQIIAALNMTHGSYSLSSGIHGAKWVPRFFVDIKLPNGMIAQKIAVTEGKPIGCDMLIGMDIISRGDFMCSYCNGTTHFGFRTPSQITPDMMAEILK